MRQLTEKLGPQVARYTTLAEYEEGLPWPVAFPPARPAVTQPAGQNLLHRAPCYADSRGIIRRNGLRCFRSTRIVLICASMSATSSPSGARLR